MLRFTSPGGTCRPVVGPGAPRNALLVGGVVTDHASWPPPNQCTMPDSSRVSREGARSPRYSCQGLQIRAILLEQSLVEHLHRRSIARLHEMGAQVVVATLLEFPCLQVEQSRVGFYGAAAMKISSGRTFGL